MVIAHDCALEYRPASHTSLSATTASSLTAGVARSSSSRGAERPKVLVCYEGVGLRDVRDSPSTDRTDKDKAERSDYVRVMSELANLGVCSFVLSSVVRRPRTGVATPVWFFGKPSPGDLVPKGPKR